MLEGYGNPKQWRGSPISYRFRFFHENYVYYTAEKVGFINVEFYFKRKTTTNLYEEISRKEYKQKEYSL